MSKRKILVQLDCDRLPSVFDQVVATDAGAESIFSYGGVTPTDVQGLVHGAMFTRGPDDLKSTAIFVGGSDVAKAQANFDIVTKTYFGPLRCSTMLDANGANTTAAAAVLSAGKHLDLATCNALVLGGTGPVGQRAALLLARLGARVWLASRDLTKATAASETVRQRAGAGQVTPTTGPPSATPIHLLVAAGAAGVCLADRTLLELLHDRKVLIDLNAVPPLGIAGVEVMDKAKDVNGVIQYGALGVGGLKMKIHRAAIAAMFERNDLRLDAETIYDLGRALVP